MELSPTGLKKQLGSHLIRRAYESCSQFVLSILALLQITIIMLNQIINPSKTIEIEITDIRTHTNTQAQNVIMHI